MTLTQVLTALASNDVTIVLVQDDTTLIEFNASGYASIESDLGTETVETITITSSKKITLTLADSE